MRILFFFSSRRRHTRWNCDWSSDVCSSDLAGDLEPSLRDQRYVDEPGRRRHGDELAETMRRVLRKRSAAEWLRSEERREGKSVDRGGRRIIKTEKSKAKVRASEQ